MPSILSRKLVIPKFDNAAMRAVCRRVLRKSKTVTAEDLADGTGVTPEQAAYWMRNESKRKDGVISAVSRRVAVERGGSRLLT